MESADNPKSMNGQEKAEIFDQTNRFQYKTKLDSFIIDVDNLSNSITSKEISQNSRITRNLSRKGTLRGGNKIIGQDHGAGDDTAGEPISPIDGVVGGGSSTIEKHAVVVGLGSREEVCGGGGNGGGALSHEVGITTGGGAERQTFRRNSFKRSSQPCSWYLDPRKVFLLCATLSCVGTTLLIYFAFLAGTVNVEKSES